MSEERFNRLDDKIDEVKEDVAELKGEFKTHITLIEERTSNDVQILRELQPLLEAIPSIETMVGDFEYKKENRRRNKDKLKSAGVKLGISATLISIALGALKLLSF